MLKKCWLAQVKNKRTKLNLVLAGCYKTGMKGCFNSSPDGATDMQVYCLPPPALIKVLLDQMTRNNGLHIWREVPFTPHKETGRRKTKQGPQGLNDQTFQSNWDKHAASDVNTRGWSGRYNPQSDTGVEAIVGCYPLKRMCQDVVFK